MHTYARALFFGAPCGKALSVAVVGAPVLLGAAEREAR
jgi:hypothetical protein